MFKQALEIRCLLSILTSEKMSRENDSMSSHAYFSACHVLSINHMYYIHADKMFQFTKSVLLLYFKSHYNVIIHIGDLDFRNIDINVESLACINNGKYSVYLCTQQKIVKTDHFKNMYIHHTKQTSNKRALFHNNLWFLETPVTSIQ